MSAAGQKDTMMLDLVDADDQVVGKVRRGDVFRKQAGFRVAHVFLFDHRGRLLLQRLAQVKTRHPGRWGSSVAGYVEAGEDYAGAARRRALTELGVSDLSLMPLLKTTMSDSGCTKFIQLYGATNDGPFTPDPDEVSDLRFESLEAIHREIRRDPESFTPTFTYLFQKHMASHRAE